MIAFPCPACRKKLSVKDEFAGKRGVCPHCKQPVVVPQAAPTAAGTEATVSQPGPVAAPDEGLGFLAPPQQPDEIGRLGAYRVLKVLGAGGMGLVLHAEDPALKRSVALKVMRPELAAAEGNRQRFLREAQATAAVEHPNIVHIHQVGQDRGVPFLAMPFLKGETLDQRLKREGKVPVAAAVRIARQVAEGLASAHERGLIHRDIKPANLWLEDKTGLVKILDFGLARSSSDDVHLTKTGAILGTPAYMAPEQATARPVDGRCDLFSLGAVLYRMLAGELPFKGTDTMSMLMALATETPPPIARLNPEVPPALADLVMQLLAKQPEQRPASAQLVVEQLAAIEGAATALSSVRQALGPGTRPNLLLLPLRALRVPGPTGLAIKAGMALAVLLLLLYVFLPRAAGPTPGKTDPDRIAGPTPQFTNALGMEFVRVPKGKAWLGGRSEQPGQEAEIKYDFYLGKYEVTQEEWRKVMGKNPDSAQGAIGVGERLPAAMVTWENCQAFVKQLNERVPEAGWVYRLPKEVEWEYACRGGPMAGPKESVFSFYLDKPVNSLAVAQANFADDKALKRSCNVGSYPANRLGLHDMHGNVFEWCSDEIRADANDPRGPLQRPYRGGSFECLPVYCTATHRDMHQSTYRYPDLGLRLARVPAGQ